MSNIERNLSELMVSEKAIIKKVSAKGSIKTRLNELGFIVGEQVECSLKSPTNDPTAYIINGTTIAIRNNVSCNIIIE